MFYIWTLLEEPKLGGTHRTIISAIGIPTIPSKSTDCLKYGT